MYRNLEKIASAWGTLLHLYSSLQMTGIPLCLNIILSTFLLPLLFLLFFLLPLLFFIYCLCQMQFLSLNQEHLYREAVEPQCIWELNCNYVTLLTIHGLSMPCFLLYELICMGRFQGLLTHVEFLLSSCHAELYLYKSTAAKQIFYQAHFKFTYPSQRVSFSALWANRFVCLYIHEHPQSHGERRVVLKKGNNSNTLYSYIASVSKNNIYIYIEIYTQII